MKDKRVMEKVNGQTSGQENEEIAEKMDVTRVSERVSAGTKMGKANLCAPGR